MPTEYFEKFNGRYARDLEGQEKLADLKAYIGYPLGEDVYGAQIDYENQTETRLAAATDMVQADFDEVGPWSRMKRCNLADDGTVNAYYGDNGYIENGSNGQVMVEIPKFYYKVVPLKLKEQSWEDYNATEWTSGTSYAAGAIVTYTNAYYACITANSDEEFTVSKWHEIDEMGLMGYHLLKANYYISPTYHEGFKVHPAFVIKGAVIPQNTTRDYVYISAYEGIIYDVSASAYLLNDEQVADVANDKLSSIAGTYERSYTYYDKTNDEDVTITVNTGPKPASGETSSNNLMRANCNTLATNRGTGWNQQTIEIVSAIHLLQLIEYCGLNGQSNINQGVTTIADDGKKNCSSFIGFTSSLGNSTGAAAATLDRTGTSQTTNGKVSFSYRGIENFWGNIYKWVEGFNIYGSWNNGGGQPYICTDGVYTQDKKTDNYEGVGWTLPTASGYIKYFGYSGEKYDWLFLPSKNGSGANATKPIGDYNYVSANLNGYRVACLGGRWYNGSGAGPFCWGLNGASSARYRGVGARLAYLPA